MKKILFGLFMLMMLMIGMNSCTGCNKSQDVNNVDTTEVASDTAELNVENLISMDRQAMYNKVGEDYRWYETCMKLNNFLDEENDGSLAEVVNVFQAIIARSEHSFDTKVYKFQHFADGTYAEDSVIGFWVEDEPMNNEAIKVTYKEAYEKLMATNMPKPHSRYVTLRKQVGPIDANPQYIFGNLVETVFVDAVTGEVFDYNPAFGKEEDAKGFKMPLGEWP
jgi:hypothetical protein